LSIADLGFRSSANFKAAQEIGNGFWDAAKMFLKKSRIVAVKPVRQQQDLEPLPKPIIVPVK